jgi:hypothetical protein
MQWFQQQPREFFHRGDPSPVASFSYLSQYPCRLFLTAFTSLPEIISRLFSFEEPPYFHSKYTENNAVGGKFKSGRDFFRVLITIIGGQDSLIQQWAGQPRFNSQQWQEIFLYSTVSKLAFEPTLPHVQWVLRAISRGLSSWGVKTEQLIQCLWCNCASIPPYVFMA